MKFHRTAAVLCSVAAISALAAPAYAASSPDSSGTAAARAAELPFTEGSAELSVNSRAVALAPGASGPVQASSSVNLDVSGELTAAAQKVDGGTAVLADFRVLNRATGVAAVITEVRVDLATGKVTGRVNGGATVTLGTLDPADIDVNADGSVQLRGDIELDAKVKAQLRALLGLSLWADLDLDLDLDVRIDVQLALSLGVDLRLRLDLGDLLRVRLTL
ncbi:hypothetical protein AB0M28_03580 [Streptomyces sp. NPDC051940]|uniref:hypothetical protein n=1 Tax=Streptomyces sp. NPDC051940 TaxID=3155675 RepID=UPI00343C4690